MINDVSLYWVFMHEKGRIDQNGLKVRLATIGDLPHILPLMEQLGYPQTLEQLEKRFEYFISQEDYGVAVAELKHKILVWVA